MVGWRIWDALPPGSNIHLERPFAVGHRQVTEINVRNYAFDPTLAPPGCSVIQAMFNTEFDL